MIFLFLTVTLLSPNKPATVNDRASKTNFSVLKAKKSLACKLLTSSYAQPKYDPLSCSVLLVKVTFEPQLLLNQGQMISTCFSIHACHVYKFCRLCVVNLVLSPHHTIVAFYIQNYWSLHPYTIYNNRKF